MEEAILNFSMAEQKSKPITKTIQQFGNKLFSFVRGKVNTNEDAEDILQDVWYQLTSVIDTESIEQLSSWLFRVSRNRIVDKKRKQTSLSLEDLAYEDEDGEMVFPAGLFEDTIEPETEFDRAHFREALFKALDELPEKQRNVFVWNELEDMTLQQIADKTGESIKTIISRKRYAIMFLREKLQNNYKNINL